MGQSSFAETFPFRVAFENVNGIEEIEAGNIAAGIEILEDQLLQIDTKSSGNVLATLCAAYVVTGSLNKAAFACDRAVEIDPTETAYNNRGVYRAFTGNLTGAREDFEQARPRQLEAYIDELRTKDVPLMAVGNYRLVDKLLAKRASEELDTSAFVDTAAIQSPVE